MALDDIIRSAVRLADSLTTSLQSSVTHSSYLSQDAFGAATYSSPVTRTAIIELKSTLRQTSSNRIVLTTARITFLTPQLIDTRDIITLQNGSTGPIVDVVGVVDPDSGKPYASEVWLG